MYAGRSFNNALAGLRRTTWLELALYAFYARIIVSLLKHLAPGETHETFDKFGFILPLLFLMAKEWAHTPDVLRRLQTATGWQGRIAALLPPELVGLFRLDRLMWFGCMQWLSRRAPPAKPKGIDLSYLKRGSYGTAIACAMLFLFVELPIDVLIVNFVFKEHPDVRLIVHVIAVLAVLYSFVWVLADRWYVGDGTHVLADEVLHLRVGVRSQASIPLAAIERCDRLAEDPYRWRRRHGIHRADTLSVTPFDTPNCILVLKPDAALTILHWQVRRNVPRYVLLYLDAPDLLASRVRIASGYEK